MSRDLRALSENDIEILDFFIKKFFKNTKNALILTILVGYSWLPKWKSWIHASIYKRHSTAPVVNKDVLNSWYRSEGWRGTGIVQYQSWDQVSANNRLRSNASIEPVQIPILAWYQCPVLRQYQWSTSSQVTFRSRAGSRPCLCQHYACITPVLQILLRYWRGTKPVVNFHLGNELLLTFSTVIKYVKAQFNQ